ncbi:glycosyltransferase 87 family protein [Nocardia aurantia]|uniref:Polyprenol-phosphate-mannose-dependent alpha-(1-2)-phosphatidylinositol mannoside mannosyltransferase n=1 Tax=Nocardia aurantia TaxID=2585199 RepID=A0A7K0DFT6_9NOCA|nr:glycosyltransferase 87 family protein [Nocardia aurantia]MQY24665.1 Polyprenol-phosphate-mannose-dependent alpha-(1-2)-phosphatidylinositol mannoside mannosyltransferase [Nocardia aurantia]
MNDRARLAASGDAPDDPRAARNRRLLWIAVGLFLFSALIEIVARQWAGYIDLQVYRNGARVWLDGRDLYGPLPLSGGLGLPFTYPPPAALFFVPLALMPLWLAGPATVLVSVLCLGLTLWVVLDVLELAPDRVTRWALVIGGAGLLGLTEPVRQTYNFGQVNLVLMTAIALDVLVRRPAWPRGMLIGIAIAVKLTPAGFLLYFLVRRDWRSMLTTVVSALVTVGIGVALFPHESGEYWSRVIRDTGRIGPPAFAGNQSLKGMVFRLGLGEQAATRLWLTLAVVTVALAAVVMWRLLRTAHPTGLEQATALLVNALAVLLVSPVSWSHHWVWVAPAVPMVLVWLRRAGFTRARLATAGAIALMFLIGPHWLLPHSGHREHGWALWQQAIGSSYVLVAFAGLLAVAATCFRRNYRGARNAASAAA